MSYQSSLQSLANKYDDCHEHQFFIGIEALIMKYKIQDEIFESYIAPINQFCVICKIDKLCNWHEKVVDIDFLDELEKSFILVKANPALHVLMHNVNKLAEIWDSALFIKHNGRIACHQFMILSSSKGYNYSSMFNIYDQPDTRLGFIHIDSKTTPQESLLITLHEVGHFIGCRNRELRKNHYIELVASTLCSELFRQCCCDAMNAKSRDEITPLLDSEIYISKYTSSVLKYTRSALEAEYIRIKSLIEKEYTDLQNTASSSTAVLKMEELDKTIQADNTSNEAKQENPFSLYFREMAVLMNLSIKNVIAKFKRDINDHPNVTKIVKEMLLRALNELSQEYETEHRYQWLDFCMLQLSEPAADIFMIKVTNIKARRCLKHLLYASLSTIIEEYKNEVSSEFFCRFISNDLMRTRLLAICSILKAKGIHLLSFPFLPSSKGRVMHDATRMLHAMNKIIQREEQLRGNSQKFHPEFDIWNPQLQINAYTRQIFQDGFYKSILFDRKTRGIIRVLNCFKTSSNFILNAHIQLLKCTHRL